MRFFFWSGSDMSIIRVKVVWDQVCFLKKEGGLGIKRITEWNKIVLLKYIWNLCNDSDGLIWFIWIRFNFLRGRNFWIIKASGSCFWVWGKILKFRFLVWPKMKYIIGDGMIIFLWFDNWYFYSSFADIYGERFIYDSGMEYNARVNVLINNLEWRIFIIYVIGWYFIIEVIFFIFIFKG